MAGRAFAEEVQGLGGSPFVEDTDPEIILQSDYWRMYNFKVEKCSRMDPHDWTLCQFAHPTEKAKRRDPTKFVYNYNSCTEFRKHGSCRSGDNCAFAHGVFEGWLSPQKYHTEMCTLGRHACTRRVCFFAHSQTELREIVPETLEETAKLKDQLLVEMFQNPMYAKKLQQLLSVMTPTQASEVIGERLAYLQFFLNQFGPQALPALMKCSHSDLQDLMGSLRAQAQKEREHVSENSTLAQQRIDAHMMSRIAEADSLKLPIIQRLNQLYGNVPFNEADAAHLFSRITVSNPPSSEEQYSGRSSMDSYFTTAQAGQYLTPPRSRSSNLTGYSRSLESSGTYEARSSLDATRSSIDSVDTVRSAPRRQRVSVRNLFGNLPPTVESFDAQNLPQVSTGRRSLDSAYHNALLAKSLSLGTPLQSPLPQSPSQGSLAAHLSASYVPAPGELMSSQSGSLPALNNASSADLNYTLALLASQGREYGAV